MKETEARVDDKYTEGIWHDTMYGDFCEIQRGTNDVGQRVAQLVNPENGNVYHEIPVEEWQSKQRDFVRVEQKAVENPVDFYKATVENLVEASQYGGAELSYSGEASFRYAREHVEIIES